MKLFERLDRFDRLTADRLQCSFIGTTAAIIGAVALGGSAVASGVMAKKGADAQANAVKDASAAAVAEQQRQYDLNRQDLAPWRTAGGGAVNKLSYLLGIGPNPGAVNAQPGGTRPIQMGGPQGFNTSGFGQYGHVPSKLSRYGNPNDGTDVYGSDYLPQPTSVTAPSSDQGYDSQGGYGSLLKDFTTADFQADPGYQFTLSEGAKALERSHAANGTFFSGGTLKDLTAYNENMAATQFDNAYNRFNTNKLNRYNMLSGLSQGGQQATNATVAAGTNKANNISNITVNAGEQIGNARASGYAGIGQAINGGINNALSMYLLSRKGK